MTAMKTAMDEEVFCIYLQTQCKISRNYKSIGWNETITNYHLHVRKSDGKSN